jgi:GNAT superfamily N-acetyltransferase
MNIEICKVSDSNISELNILNPIGEEIWESEFFDSRKQPSFVFAARNDSRFLGVEGYVSYQLINSKSIFESHRSERTIVLPELRGHGIFNKLIEACHAESMIYNSVCCWGATSALKPFEKAGFQSFTKWRSYYFIPLGLGFKKWGFKHFCKIIIKARLFYKKRNFDDFLKLGSGLADLLIVKKKKSNWTCHQIDFSSYQSSYLVLLESTQSTFNDFAMNSSKNLFEWLEERGIQLECIEVKDEFNEVIAILAYRRTDYAFILEDWVIGLNIKFSDIVVAFRAYLKASDNSTVNSLIVSLNIKNEYHNWMSKSMSKWRIKSPNVGSFVIKNGIKNIDIKDLRINPIWLEL